MKGGLPNVAVLRKMYPENDLSHYFQEGLVIFLKYNHTQKE